MRKRRGLAGVALLVGSAAYAQEGARPAAPAGTACKCGANGYARTADGSGGYNDGIAHP